MAKVIKQFVCSSCGSAQPKWQGKCPDCGAWNTLEEMIQSKDTHRGTAHNEDFTHNTARPLSQIVKDAASKPPMRRISTGISELDRVLGGSESLASGVLKQTSGGSGFVPGSAILLGGDPGIGKSTLLLQAADQLNRAEQTVLYVTSEESEQQLQLRADRLDVDTQNADHLLILADTNLARIAQQIRKTQPAVVIIDSVQMIYKSDLAAAPGSITQLRTCCLELVYLAKAQGCCVILVGHVTKDGKLAGPRMLEHMVDTVLYFEGDRYHSHRIIRSIKNRFGTTLEVGLFEMCAQGLVEVTNGAGLLANQYKPQSGSVVCPVMQGTRCLMVEFQALTATGFLGSAKRKSSGLDSNRLAMLIAVLEKRGGLRLADQDIFTSVVGGLKVAEPAADLAIALAIAGAFGNRQIGVDKGSVCVLGEVGLSGEIRLTQHLEQRIIEAQKLGFSHIIGPKAPKHFTKNKRYIEVDRIETALEFLN